MRRTHASRIASRRRLLAFEPLESRELLAADAGSDWWSAWDVPVADDWSWTFDDASGVDTGDQAWWDDSWWAGEASWDPTAFDGTGFGSFDVGSDAGGADAVGWDVGGTDAGWIEDAIVEIVVPSAPGVADGTTHEPQVTIFDVVVPPAPDLVANGAVVTPGLNPNIEPPAPVVSPAWPPAVAGLEADPACETPDPSPPIVVILDGGAIDDVEIVVSGDPVAEAGVTVADVTVDEGPVAVDFSTGESTDDMTHGEWVVETTPVEGMPINEAGSVGEAAGDSTAGDSSQPQTTVIVTSVIGGSTVSAAVASGTAQPAALNPVVNRFAAWGALFAQGFGRPTGTADATIAGGQADGQPGSGRPRLRLPFRPFA